MPQDLVPSAALEGSGFVLPAGDLLARDVHRGARDGVAAAPDPDEIEPRAVRKAGRAEPSVDATRRGDPAVGMPPTFAARFGKPGLPPDASPRWPASTARASPAW